MFRSVTKASLLHYSQKKMPMNSSQYPIRGYNAIVSFIGFGISFLAVGINLLKGDWGAIIYACMMILMFLQYRWSKGYLMEITGTQLTFRPSWAVTREVDLSTLERFEIEKNKRIILYPSADRKITIHLDVTPKNYKEKALKEIPAIIEGSTLMDFTEHLISED